MIIIDIDFGYLLGRCHLLLDQMRELCYGFFEFLFKPIMQIEGTPEAYVFVFSGFVGLIVTRILLAINK